MKSALFIIAYFLVSLSLNGQTDFKDLQQRFLDNFQAKNDSVLHIAHNMNKLSLREEGDSSYWYALSSGYLGRVFQFYGKVDSMKYYMSQAFNLFEKYHFDRLDDIHLLDLRIDYFYEVLGDYDSTFNLVKQCLKVKKKYLSDDDPLIATTLSLLGDFYLFLLNDFIAAESSYSQAADIRQRSLGSLNHDFAVSLLKLGNSNFYLGNFKLSDELWTEARDIFIKGFGVNYHRVLTIENNLAMLYNKLGYYDLARKMYASNLEKTRIVQGEESRDYAASLHNLSAFLNEMGDYSGALLYSKKAEIATKEALGSNHQDYAVGLLNTGQIHHEMSNYREAENILKKALVIFEKVNGGSENNLNIGFTLGTLGTIYSEMGDYKSAIMLNEKEIEINKNIYGEDSVRYVTSLYNSANLFKKIGKYSVAENIYKRLLILYINEFGDEHREYARNLLGLGDLYMIKGDFGLAKEYFKESLRVHIKSLGADHPEVASANKHIADLYAKLNDFKSAEIHYRQSLIILENIFPNYNADYVSVENKLAYCLIKLNRISEAYEILKYNFNKLSKQITNDFEWLSENQKEAYWKHQYGFYDKLSWLASKAKTKVPEAVALNYNGALITKSKLLETKISKENYYIEVDEIREELSYRKKLLNKLESDGSDKRDLMDKLRHESDSLDKQLELSWPAYAEQKRNLLITWDKVHQNLSAGEAAIEFVRFREDEDSAYQYQALIIRKDLELPVLAPLCDESQLAQLEPRIDFGEYYPLVWKPIEKYLKDIHTIYYAPVGELYNLPFHSFLVPREKEGQRYLMDKYKLHQLTSTRYLAMGLKDKQKERMSPSISIVGGVNYDYLPGSSNNVRVNNNFASTRDLGSASAKVRFLPGTVKEAKAIESVLSKNRWETTYLKGGNAKEERLTEFSHKNAKGIMHIATHGYAFPEYSSMDTTIKENSIRYSYRYSNNPMVRSGLVLAGGNWALMGSDTLTQLGAPENGVLTALEVSQLNLRNTKLVVLSACETGLGQIEGSEGTFGLKRGFKLAGVEQMIVSLWSVPDKETKELMTIFYTDLAQTLDPVSSFQYAQNKMRDKYPIYPEKWAGFVLVR